MVYVFGSHGTIANCSQWCGLRLLECRWSLGVSGSTTATCCANRRVLVVLPPVECWFSERSLLTGLCQLFFDFVFDVHFVYKVSFFYFTLFYQFSYHFTVISSFLFPFPIVHTATSPYDTPLSLNDTSDSGTKNRVGYNPIWVDGRPRFYHGWTDDQRMNPRSIYRGGAQMDRNHGDKVSSWHH